MVPNGGDYIEVRGKMRHVYGYLKDFMFDPSEILETVSTLSGGQKNRLKLAKVLANPKSCLILDEPTNDLDMETLDMLGEILMSYKGTLLLVSHDRDFLDQTVTKILSFEGNGVVEETIGGYSDYLAFKKSNKGQSNIINNENNLNKKSKQKSENVEVKNNRKLTYKLEFELKNLPVKIMNKENEINKYNHRLADPDFYINEPDLFNEVAKKLELAKKDLEYFETRWIELEEMKN
jgi:ATP-binding cassette subfamily F protein uup